MTKEVLTIISNAMCELGLDYSFGINRNPQITYPYFVGSYSEVAGNTEDGLQEATFSIDGFSRTTWEALEDAKQAIEECFGGANGMTLIADNGNGVCVAYNNALAIPTGDAELMRIQINLGIKEWRTN